MPVILFAINFFVLLPQIWLKIIPKDEDEIGFYCESPQTQHDRDSYCSPEIGLTFIALVAFLGTRYF